MKKSNGIYPKKGLYNWKLTQNLVHTGWGYFIKHTAKCQCHFLHEAALNPPANGAFLLTSYHDSPVPGLCIYNLPIHTRATWFISHAGEETPLVRAS